MEGDYITASKNRLKFSKLKAEREWGIHLGVADFVLLFEGVFPCESYSFDKKIQTNAEKYNFNSKEMNKHHEYLKNKEWEEITRWSKEGGFGLKRFNKDPKHKLKLYNSSNCKEILYLVHESQIIY